MEKRKNMRFATGMLAAVLLFGTSGQTWAREEADIGWIAMPTGDMAERELSKPMEMLSSSDTENLNKKMGEDMQDGAELLPAQQKYGVLLLCQSGSGGKRNLRCHVSGGAGSGE